MSSRQVAEVENPFSLKLIFLVSISSLALTQLNSGATITNVTNASGFVRCNNRICLG